MKAVAGRAKDLNDISVLITQLALQGCTYEHYKERVYQLYNGTIKPKIKLDKGIKTAFTNAYKGI